MLFLCEIEVTSEKQVLVSYHFLQAKVVNYSELKTYKLLLCACFLTLCLNLGWEPLLWGTFARVKDVVMVFLWYFKLLVELVDLA